MDYKDRIDELVSDRKKFDEVVYTPVNEVISELEKRWKSQDLENKIEFLFGSKIPEYLRSCPRAALLRHVCTPNYEIHRFICALDVIGLPPLFGEYHQDKFVPENLSKYHLGKMHFNIGFGKKGNVKIETKKIVDFNSYNGSPLSLIKTVWNQNLIDFHHELFISKYPHLNQKDIFFDASEWLKVSGGCAEKYYDKVMLLFVRNAILFENYVLSGRELEFTKNIFLPSFFRVWEMTGKKPLIVALEPTDIEGDNFWLCYTPEMLSHINKKLNNGAIV